MNSISQPENNFVIKGIKENIRVDGRERLQYREIKCDRSVIEQANGSVRIKLGNTEVVVGIKCELGQPSPNMPDQGRYEVFVKQYGAMSLRDIETERMLTVALENAGKDTLKKLCVVPHKLCWVIYVDAVVVEDDGDIMDCVSLGVRAGLLNTILPKVNVVSGKSENIQVEIDEDSVDFQTFDQKSLPLCITLTSVCFTFEYPITSLTQVVRWILDC